MNTPNDNSRSDGLHDSKVWFALVESGPLVGNNDFGVQALGAYVNVVGFASDSKAFEREIHQYFSSHNVQVVSVEDVMPLDDVLAYKDVEEPLLQAARTLTAQNPLGLGTLFTFDA